MLFINSISSHVRKNFGLKWQSAVILLFRMKHYFFTNYGKELLNWLLQLSTSSSCVWKICPSKKNLSSLTGSKNILGLYPMVWLLEVLRLENRNVNQLFWDWLNSYLHIFERKIALYSTNHHPSPCLYLSHSICFRKIFCNFISALS